MERARKVDRVIREENQIDYSDDGRVVEGDTGNVGGICDGGAMDYGMEE